jgi:hypothetical protein
VPIKGLLLATGNVSYIDDTSFEKEDGEIVFVDEDVYVRNKYLIYSGQKKIGEISSKSVGFLPDNFIPGGHLNRAADIIKEVNHKIKDQGGEFLDYVNAKRKEIARERGLPEGKIKNLKQKELLEIIENVYFTCRNKSAVTASANQSNDQKYRWIIFALSYLSTLSDEEFGLVYSHELGHIIVDMSLPDSDMESKLYEAMERMGEKQDIKNLSAEFSRDERDILSRIFVKREDIADLTSVTITGGTLDKLRAAIKKGRDIDTEENPAHDFIASLGIETHPDLFIRGFLINMNMIQEKFIQWFKHADSDLLKIPEIKLTLTSDITISDLLEIRKFDLSVNFNI